MPKSTGPDHDNTSEPDGFDSDSSTEDGVTEGLHQGADPAGEQSAGLDSATEVISTGGTREEREVAPPVHDPRQRRFTAPGFDAKETAVIQTTADPATEAFRPRSGPQRAQEPTGEPTRTAMPQLIPPRLGSKLRPTNQRSWGWVLALILIILTLAAIAVLATVLLTHKSKPKASQEDQVRGTIQSFDIAVQNGDLAVLRSLTCGSFRDDYVSYDDQGWADTYHRVAAAKQYPVVASIDQVVVNGGHAEANVTAFMAYAPQTRSSRSFDLQFRDDQWKICQSSNS
ncbi:MAG: hypothetical protein WA317_19460 [Mycobacterium sp.]|uniref:Rv0361 family membrane protein n=1 Tax=Mycobacterium sp. TaxID=1785 RepID=UPI003CC5A8C6